ITFQRAPPEANGLGSITWRPGLIRSSQVLMFFGLPLRTANTTTELVTNPCSGPLSQPAATFLASTSLSTSGASDSATTSAGSPASTARAWSPEGPNDCVNDTPLPSVVWLKAGISAAYASFGVE